MLYSLHIDDFSGVVCSLAICYSCFRSYHFF
uniref:Uncharacterized protein n=1 Tax=Rhizophora mucronata TaxID=61149 RepID=A0A2P2M4S6_RHIMU